MKIAEQASERHVLNVIVDNEAGILAKISGLFTARGYNIDSLTVADISEDHAISRVTVVTNGPPPVIDQIRSQLERLVPVHKVIDLTEEAEPEHFAPPRRARVVAALRGQLQPHLAKRAVHIAQNLGLATLEQQLGDAWHLGRAGDDVQQAAVGHLVQAWRQGGHLAHRDGAWAERLDDQAELRQFVCAVQHPLCGIRAQLHDFGDQ